MADQLLIREVPEEIATWIRTQRGRTGRTQNEIILDLLRDSYERNQQLGLFTAPARTEVVPGTLPFTFIDLFAGIGGIRLGLEGVGGRCVFTSEWDKWSQKTYHAWFGEMPAGNIREVDAAEVPDHDVLAAGFPCQPFSIAGVSKKKSLGRTHGFEDETQGNLFFEIARIVRAKKPPVLFLENVKNLRGHDGGRTWKVISSTLHDLGYRVFSEIVDAAGWLPQHRERIFIVCFRRDLFGDLFSFDFPRASESRVPKLRELLETSVDARYTLTAGLWEYLQEYAKKHKAKGNGFGFGLADLDGTTRTLSARYYKDGSEILIPQKRKNPRRLTPRECARLMGFPDEKPIVVSDTQAYRQFGNSVCVPVVSAIAREIVSRMSAYLYARGYLLAAAPSSGANGTRDLSGTRAR